MFAKLGKWLGSITTAMMTIFQNNKGSNIFGAILLVVILFLFWLAAIAVSVGLIFGIWSLAAWLLMLALNCIFKYLEWKAITFWMSFSIIFVLGYLRSLVMPSKS